MVMANSSAEQAEYERPNLHGNLEESLLGVHPLAAFQEAPQQPGVGILLPAWRRISELLAPLFHQVFRHALRL
jgi:hypothetical protein